MYGLSLRALASSSWDLGGAMCGGTLCVRVSLPPAQYKQQKPTRRKRRGIETGAQSGALVALVEDNPRAGRGLHRLPHARVSLHVEVARAEVGMPRLPRAAHLPTAKRRARDGEGRRAKASEGEGRREKAREGGRAPA